MKILKTGLLGLVIGAAPLQAAVVDLTFDSPFTTTNIGDLNGYGAGYSDGLIMDFKNVATESGVTIDARVTAVVPNNTTTTFANGGSDNGFIPNYKATTVDEPNDDLGFRYIGNGLDTTGGVTFTIDFFDGTGGASGDFSTAYSIADLELLIYDVDGSSGSAKQDEWFDAYFADGLYSYATGNGAASLTASSITGGVNFFGPQQNFPEDDASGAVILRYLDTDSVTLAFGSYIHEDSNATNDGVFTAIDGNLSLLTNRDDFEDPTTVVPVPPAVWLFGSGLLGMVGIARRKKV